VTSTPAVEWPSGEATACKAVHTGSIPVSTSNSLDRARLAQRESASLTRKRSLVQSQYRAPQFVQLRAYFRSVGPATCTQLARRVTARSTAVHHAEICGVCLAVCGRRPDNTLTPEQRDRREIASHRIPVSTTRRSARSSTPLKIIAGSSSRCNPPTDPAPIVVRRPRRSRVQMGGDPGLSFTAWWPRRYRHRCRSEIFRHG
jgi:hypothetical protein